MAILMAPFIHLKRACCQFQCHWTNFRFRLNFHSDWIVCRFSLRNRLHLIERYEINRVTPWTWNVAYWIWTNVYQQQIGLIEWQNIQVNNWRLLFRLNIVKWICTHYHFEFNGSSFNIIEINQKLLTFLTNLFKSQVKFSVATWKPQIVWLHFRCVGKMMLWNKHDNKQWLAKRNQKSHNKLKPEKRRTFKLF